MELNLLQQKIHFRNRVMQFRLSNIISKKEYDLINKLTHTGTDEDFELAKQLLRQLLLSS